MAKRKLRLSRQANEDIAAFLDESLQEWGDEHHERSVKNLTAALAAIERSPTIFPKHHLDDRARFRMVDRRPYKVIFVIAQSEILVIGVLHANASAKHWLTRLS